MCEISSAWWFTSLIYGGSWAGTQWSRLGATIGAPKWWCSCRFFWKCKRCFCRINVAPAIADGFRCILSRITWTCECAVIWMWRCLCTSSMSSCAYVFFVSPLLQQLDAHSDTIEPINNDPDNSDSQALAKFTELIEKRKRFTSSKHRRIGRSMPNIPLTFDSNDASEGMRGFCIGEDDCDVTVSRTVSGSATGENACPRSRRSSRTGIVSHPIALPPLSLNNDMCSATMPSSHHDSVVATPQRPQRRAVAPMPLERVDLQAGGGAAERGGLYSMRNGFPSIPTASDLAQLESDISATLQRGRTHSMSSHRSTDRARSLSPPVTRHRHRIQMHGDGTADDDRQWLEEKLKQVLLQEL